MPLPTLAGLASSSATQWAVRDGAFPWHVVGRHVTSASVARRYRTLWNGARPMRASLVIVGAGSRGTSVLERIAANAPELYERSGAAGLGLDIHLNGAFRARPASVPGAVVEARALVEARLPHPTVERSRAPLLRDLSCRATA